MSLSSQSHSQSSVNQSDPIEKQLLLQEMMRQIVNVQQKFQSEGEDEERRWMIARTSDDQIADFLKESTIIMLHVIDAVGDLQPVNGITISKRFGIPRGSVSKITRRLAEQHILQAESLEGNKKEVLFHLTPMGREIYVLHKKLHEHMQLNIKRFLGRYDAEQMRFLISCLQDTVEASWVQDANDPDVIRALEDDKKGMEQKPIVEANAPSPSLETGTISEIVDMLQQLDARSLKKAKNLIQVALFD
jgi:DNA-binding MarR family transcriptional regulator